MRGHIVCWASRRERSNLWCVSLFANIISILLFFVKQHCHRLHLSWVDYTMKSFLLCLCVSMQELKFTLAVTKMKGYFEAFFEQPPPFTLSLIEINTEETVWSATIREGTSAFSLTLNMLVDLQVKKTSRC